MQMTENRKPIVRAFGHYRVPRLLALVALADILIFNQAPGLNLFLFAISITATMLVAPVRPLSWQAATGWFLFSALASVPLLESPSIAGLSVALCAILCVALASARLVPMRLARLPFVLIRFLPAIPLRLAADGRHHFRSGSNDLLPALKRHLGAWMLPLVLACAFLILFAIANPVIETVLRNIDLAFLLQFMDIRRLCFWFLAAGFVWAMLRPRLIRRKARHSQGQSGARRLPKALFDHASLLRSLALFNALFAVQSMLDLFYLWGGADLPDGMTHAEYAHRGAYPLIITALMAAAFVLIAMRHDGPGDRSPVIRGLVYAWIGQNVLLCLSSILRLDLYVEVYSLTELRVAAGIWMGLVAIGLVLILLRIILRRSNQWLIASNITALVAVVYVCALIDMPSFIARFNVDHSAEFSRQGVPLDSNYLASLGPSAIPALDVYLAALPAGVNKRWEALQVREMLIRTFKARGSDWRSWTFRTARLDSYLQPHLIVAR